MSADKHKQRLLRWLDNFDIGDELRDQIAETLAHPLSEAVAEEREVIARDLLMRSQQYRNDGFDQIADEFYRVSIKTGEGA